MNKNHLKFFKLILQNNSLLRTLQILECLNIALYGISLEFGATNIKNKTFSSLSPEIHIPKILLSKSLCDLIEE